MRRIPMGTAWKTPLTIVRGLTEPRPSTKTVAQIETVMAPPISTMDGQLETPIFKMNSQQPQTVITTESIFPRMEN